MFACGTIMFMKKNDKILAAAVFAAAAGLFLFQHWQQTHFAGNAVIYEEKEKTASYPLNEDAQIELFGADGGMNRICIQAGKVWMESANCPDGLCMKQGSIEKNGQSIICLPHRLVIMIEGGTDAGVDAVAR